MPASEDKYRKTRSLEWVFRLFNNKISFMIDIKQKNKQAIIVLYNQLINFFWTILAFTPVVYFCYQYMPLNLLY